MSQTPLIYILLWCDMVFQIIDPRLEAVAPAGGNLQHFRLRIHRAQVGQAEFPVPLQHRREVDLGQEHQRGDGKKPRVLDRFFFSLRRGEQRNLRLFAEVEGDRADQVADVLDQEQAGSGRNRLFQHGMNLFGVEVAAVVGFDLGDRCATVAHPFGVDFAVLVADDHRGRNSGLAERVERFLQKRRLARAGGRDQIERDNAALA